MNEFRNTPRNALQMGQRAGGENVAHTCHRCCSALLVLAALLLPLAVGVMPATVYAQGRTSVAISAIEGTTLYRAPGGAVVTTIASGQPLTVTGRSADRLWVAVARADGSTGWAAVEQLIIFGVERLPIVEAAVVSEALDTESVGSETVVSETVASEAVASETVASETVASAIVPERSEAFALAAEIRLPSGRLNVRAAPGTASTIIGKAYGGDAVVAIGRDSSGEWLQIQWPSAGGDRGIDDSVTTAENQIGWVAARYVVSDGALDALPISTSVSATASDMEMRQPSTITDTTSNATSAAASGGAVTTLTTSSQTSSGTAGNSATGLSGTLVIQRSPGGMIYGYNLATGALWSIANGFDPAISPDGSTVAFVREGGENGIYLTNIDGSNERLIFSGRTRLSSPKWSPDGNWILFTRSDEYSECVDMGRGGCVSVNSLPPGVPTAELTLSKDYEYNLAVVDRNGDNYHDIAALESARVADWNRAGIVYQSAAGLQITADSADAENRLLLFTPLQPPYEDPDWQPNGNQVLFVQHHGSHYEIFTIGSDGSGMTALTRPVTTLVDQMPNNLAPAWSPDGQHIVFLSNRAANNEAGAWRVWVMDADGSNQRPLPIDLTINYTYGNEQAVDWGR